MKDPFGSSLLVSSSNVALKPLQRVFHKTTASYKREFPAVSYSRRQEAR